VYLFVRDLLVDGINVLSVRSCTCACETTDILNGLRSEQCRRKKCDRLITQDARGQEDQGQYSSYHTWQVPIRQHGPHGLQSLSCSSRVGQRSGLALFPLEGVDHKAAHQRSIQAAVDRTTGDGTPIRAPEIVPVQTAQASANGHADSSDEDSALHFVLQVLILKGAYKGQKLIMLVARKTTASTNSTIPSVPGIIPVKYNNAITTATMVRRIRSVVPMFGFIVSGFGYQRSSILTGRTVMNITENPDHSR
jgi:hypothetical protein